MSLSTTGNITASNFNTCSKPSLSLHSLQSVNAFLAIMSKLSEPLSLNIIYKFQVSYRSMNHIIMKRHKWKVYVCRYAEWYQCSCDFNICANCHNKTNNTRLQHSNSVNAQKLHDMFNPPLDEQTGEGHCVENPVEYHKLQYLKMSDSAHIWIPSWHTKNNKLTKQQKEKNKVATFPRDCCHICLKKFEVERV